ncbi:MAG: hypothetical protein KIT44_12260 [Opitutaceae bacterium]|nr:hypothetical protein [Opitutaceae bacterium]
MAEPHNQSSLTDYQGRAVRFTAERRAHICEHPEMNGLEQEIADTLRRPSLVVQSLSDTAAALHYRYYFGTRVGDKWLCVVVKYSALDSFVLTAYLTNKPKKGTQLWPKT